MSVQPVTFPSRSVDPIDLHDLQRLEDVGFMTCMTLVLLGNYAQTGHFGGPLAYTPFNVVTHLAGREHADEAVRALQHTAGYLRTELSHRMQLYSVPQLHFTYDDSIESGMRLSQLIDQAVAADRKPDS